MNYSDLIGVKKTMDKMNMTIEDKIGECEDQVFCRVLKEVLGREPNEEDAQHCNKLNILGMNGYLLAYKKEVLGKIEKHIENNVYYVTFKPVENVEKKYLSF